MSWSQLPAVRPWVLVETRSLPMPGEWVRLAWRPECADRTLRAVAAGAVPMSLMSLQGGIRAPPLTARRV